MKDNFQAVGDILLEYPNIMDFPVNGKYNNFDWGGIKNIFKKDDAGITAPTPTGASPTPFFPTPTGSAPSTKEGSVTAEDISAWGELAVGGLAAIKGLKSDQQKELKAVCGRRPILNGRRGVWQSCVSNYLIAKNTPVVGQEKKGLSTTQWIGIAVGSATLIGLIIFVATRKPKTIVMQAPAPVLAVAK